MYTEALSQHVYWCWSIGWSFKACSAALLRRKLWKAGNSRCKKHGCVSSCAESSVLKNQTWWSIEGIKLFWWNQPPSGRRSKNASKSSKSLFGLLSCGAQLASPSSWCPLIRKCCTLHRRLARAWVKVVASPNQVDLSSLLWLDWFRKVQKFSTCAFI